MGEQGTEEARLAPHFGYHEERGEQEVQSMPTPTMRTQQTAQHTSVSVQVTHGVFNAIYL